MKYMLLFCEDTARREEWMARPDAERDRGYEMLGQWFGSHADKLVATHELKGPRLATTVRFVDGRPVVTDGPFMEAKEAIGGYAIFEVEDAAAALELAKSWPAQGTVEIRPVVER